MSRKSSTRQILAWACLAAGLLALAYARRARSRARAPLRDYSDRSGLPRPVDDMRGAARADFDMPADMATPALLRPRVAS